MSSSLLRWDFIRDTIDGSSNSGSGQSGSYWRERQSHSAAWVRRANGLLVEFAEVSDPRSIPRSRSASVWHDGYVGRTASWLNLQRCSVQYFTDPMSLHCRVANFGLALPDTPMLFRRHSIIYSFAISFIELRASNWIYQTHPSASPWFRLGITRPTHAIHRVVSFELALLDTPKRFTSVLTCQHATAWIRRVVSFGLASPDLPTRSIEL